MIISIITLFPEMFSSVFNSSILKRAQEDGKITISIVNLREFGIGRHRTVDDKPYGGGVGMVLRIDVLARAIAAARGKEKNEKVILLDPKGKKYSQSIAEEISNLEHIVLVCGHYEGVDARIHHFIDMELSIGDYVLSGGEIPAMVVTESVARLVPGVLKKGEATLHESFSNITLGEESTARILEHPQYTRPKVYNNLSVPDILLSGNKEKVDEYRKEQAVAVTQKRRPHIL